MSASVYRVSSPLFGNFYEGELCIAEATAEVMASRLDVTMTLTEVTPEVREDGKLIASEQSRFIRDYSPRRLYMGA